MSGLFDPLRLRGVEIPNRVWMSPMCSYAAAPDGERAGAPTDFHLAHYAARAAGGAGMVVVEATAVAPEGRISDRDLGLWDDAQIPAFRRLAAAIAEAGGVPAVQIAHAGRKAGTLPPAAGGAPLPPELGWPAIAPSPIPFPGLPAPREASPEEIRALPRLWARAAARAAEAGFRAVEIHAAHGYLLHSFLSPLSNAREDEDGGPEGRSRLPLEVVAAVRAAWPEELPLLMRISTTDWVAEDPEDDRPAWRLEDALQLVRDAAGRGVDLVDCSSGGLVPAPIPRDRDYQTAKAARIRAETGVPVAAVGRIDDAATAEELVRSGRADAVMIGRGMLRDLSWANNAAAALGRPGRHPRQYAYAVRR
ncbi:MAG: NADH:flavin oxidoreductase/NADH oxidase [Pseudoclavibacter sp.]|nr:NADH:flavin oxidoreductase/NADH oxidase [Pseudoclavibacter sp.]